MKHLRNLILMLVLSIALFGCTNKKFKVSFQTGNEQVLEEIKVEKNQAITKLPNLTWEGYNFLGWYLDKDYNEKYEKQEITADTILYAKWEVKKYNVVFFVDNEAFSTQEVEYGKSAEKPDDPVKDGYTFIKWDKDFNKVTNHLEINAIFEVTTFKVTFLYPDGTEVEIQNIEYGKDASYPELTIPEGLVLDGWDKEITNITSDLIVTAKFKTATYQVKFFEEGVQIGETQIIEHGKDAISPTIEDKEGYTFIKWDKEFTNVRGNLEVHAVFEIQKFTVQFLYPDGSEIETQTVNYGKDATFPNMEVPEGKTFDGWDKEFTNVKEDLVVTAKFKTATFEVKFMVDGEQYGETQIVEYGKDAIEPTPNPDIPGVVFIQWIGDYTNVTKDLVIVAETAYKTYDILYYRNGSTISHQPNTYRIIDNIILEPLEFEGFIFVGWFLDEDFSGEPVKTIDVYTLDDINLFGKWLDMNDKLYLNYELNGGSWQWANDGTVDPKKGINEYSELPRMFMMDFYHYLKENNLLTSPIVDSTIHQTTWEGFSQQNPLHNGDPYAVYNDTTSNTAQTNNGYSQFFFDTATGNPETGELLTIEGGFLGTEPFKTKYLPLVKYIALLGHYHYNTDYQNTRIWNGASGKTLMGFMLDGYFYGTQGIGSGTFTELRKHIPNTNLEYKVEEKALVEVEIEYPLNSYVNGLQAILRIPSKDGFVFGGWYDNPELAGTAIYTIPAGVAPAEKYYAKWIEVE